MKGFGCYSLPAAIQMTRSGLDHIARESGVTVERLEGELSGGPVLSPGEGRRLRAFLWAGGVFMFDTPLFEAAVRFAPIVGFRSWAVYAERFPPSIGDGLIFSLFAKCWRAWLRVRGQGHRIGPWPKTNGVRVRLKTTGWPGGGGE